MLARAMATSREVSFHIADQKFFGLDLPPHVKEEVTYIDVSTDTLYDLVVIENITRQALKPLTGVYKSADRALLRRTRLLWEGEVVPFRSGPLPTTAPKGVVPQVIVMPATKLSIADIEIPLPKTCIRHPHMGSEAVTALPDSDPPADRMMMVVPRGEPFMAWAPEKRQIGGDDDLLQPTSWALSHFDEQPFLGRLQG
jgi:hypothetical protein